MTTLYLTEDRISELFSFFVDFYQVWISVLQIILFWKEIPYHDDSTTSCMLSEVKHHQAHLVLHWGTVLGYRVLLFLPAYHLLVRKHHMTYTNFTWSGQRVILVNLGPNFDGRMGWVMEGQGVFTCTKVSYSTLSSIINTWYPYLSHSTYSYGGVKRGLYTATYFDPLKHSCTNVFEVSWE